MIGGGFQCRLRLNGLHEWNAMVGCAGVCAQPYITGMDTISCSIYGARGQRAIKKSSLDPSFVCAH